VYEDRQGFVIEALHADDRRAGEGEVVIVGNTPRVTWISVGSAHHRRGIGTALYARMARESCRRWGQPLHSDTNRSHLAEAFWQKQLDRGRATFDGKRYRLTCPAPRSLAGTR